MINTKDYRTKTYYCTQKNMSCGDNAWGIGLDMGYSSVKAVSQANASSFPGYVKKIDPDEILPNAVVPETDILYRDNLTGEVYSVGASAQNMLSPRDTNVSEAYLYSRNHYLTDEFHIKSAVGLGMGLIANDNGNPAGKNLVVQTGLPPKYFTEEDKEMLTAGLTGDYNFSIKLAGKKWHDFEFTLPTSNIHIMMQPMGTFASVLTKSDGQRSAHNQDYLDQTKRTLIIDGGFGTLDTFDINQGKLQLSTCETYTDLGMRQVLTETARLIKDRHGVTLSVLALQQYLAEGSFLKIDRIHKKSESVPFGDILEEASNNICDLAIKKIDTVYDQLMHYDHLVVTGGTGEAWFERIKEAYASVQGLHIMPGNENSDLPFLFANARGYYLSLASTLKRRG